MVTNKKPTADFSATRGHSNRRCTAALRRHPPIQAASAGMATDNVTFVLVQGTEQRERELPKTTTLQDLAELLHSDAEIATTFVFDAAKPAMLSG